MPLRTRLRRVSRPLVWGLAAAGTLLATVMLLVMDHAGHVVPVSTSPTDLSTLKLLEEVRQLRISNDRAAGAVGILLAVAPLFTVTAGLGAGLVALFQLLHQRQQDRQHREDELMAKTLTGLGAESEAMRAASAAALDVLTQRVDDLTPDMFAIVTSQLRVNPVPLSVATPLTRTLERLLPGKVAERSPVWVTKPADRDPLPVLDLAHITAVHLDLRNLDLRGWDLDIAFSTLERARLEKAFFGHLHGYRVNLARALASRSRIQQGWLHKAIMTSAILHEVHWNQIRLNEADLTKAQFQNAELHQAKFRGAILRRTNFAGADIKEADFRETASSGIDEVTLTSILQTRNESWRTAYFDPEIRHELEQRSRGHTRQPPAVKAPASPDA